MYQLDMPWLVDIKWEAQHFLKRKEEEGSG